MRKNALIISCYVCALGAFGAFFRWLQNQICYDPVTGIMSRSAWNFLIPLAIIGVAVIFYMQIKKLLDQNLVPPMKLYDMFHGTTLVYPVLAWIIAAITAIGGLVTIVSVRYTEQAGLYTLIGLLAICSGISFPLICTCSKRRFSPGFVSALMTAPVVMFALWLIASYRQNATIASIWVYAVEILALCACLTAFFYTAGYAYGRVKPIQSLFFTMMAAFLCFMTMSDNRNTGLQLIVCGSIGMLLTEAWAIVSNMREAGEVEEEISELAEESENEPSAPETPDLEDIIREAAEIRTETTIVDDDDDVKIWNSDKK